MSFISVILIVVVAFLAGMEGILDEFQFHQPLVACTLIGLVSGQLVPCVILGGTLQMIALGWANIGAAVAPDAALASIASAIILVMGGQGEAGVDTAIAVAIPLAVAGLFLTMVVRTLSVACVHRMDASGSQRKLWRRRSMAYHRDLHAGTAYRDPGSGTACDPDIHSPGILRVHAGMAD